MLCGHSSYKGQAWEWEERRGELTHHDTHSCRQTSAQETFVLRRSLVVPTASGLQYKLVATSETATLILLQHNNITHQKLDKWLLICCINFKKTINFLFKPIQQDKEKSV